MSQSVRRLKSSTPVWYYAVFPLDAWSKDESSEAAVFWQQKQNEVMPIMIFLLPFVALLNGLLFDFGFFASLFVYALQSGLCALVCIKYLDQRKSGYIFELAINFFISLCMISLVLIIIGFLFGGIASGDWDDD